VSVFRPAVRVAGPDRREWELYAYRLPLPERRRGGVRLAVTVLWDLPRSLVRALASDQWTIEAVAWLPHRTSYRWRTSSEFRGHVLAQVEGQLARGETPAPGRATFLDGTGRY
jgi:hypothetical protein